MKIIVRTATESDARTLSLIYAPYVSTPITFECHAPDAAEFARRIRDISAVYPFLVCEVNDRIVGYSYAHRLREREAYDWSAELSIYLDGSFTGLGVGKPLYTAVLDLLALQGIKNAYGSVAVPNEKSERLHLACGFTEAGSWRLAGYKLGIWHDLKWFEKPLGDMGAPPSPFIPFPLLDGNRVAELLKVCGAEIERRILHKQKSP